MDDDGNRSLSFAEFKKGIRDHGLSFDPPTLQSMFDSFDKDKGGSIDFDEFLQQLRVCTVMCLVFHCFCRFLRVLLQ